MFYLCSTDTRFINATTKVNGDPEASEVNMNWALMRVSLRENSVPVAVESLHVPLKHHLEISVRTPPYPDKNWPGSTPYQIIINLEQPSNMTVCHTPGLTVFTSDPRDQNIYRQCLMLPTSRCKHMCTCYKYSEVSSCKLFVRLEWPIFGNWEMPNEIVHINHNWLRE